MATEWAITTAAERVPLDAKNHGEITFTVTNQGPAPDRAVLEAVPGDGADRTWFAVNEPQRFAPPGGSIAYLLATTVPPGTPAGTYWVQGRVYSADTAPEETSRLSNRVAFEVKPTVSPNKKRQWWPYAVAAGLVVVVLVVVGLFVFRPRGVPTPAAGVATPDVTNQPRAEAERILTENGLTLGEVTEVVDPARDSGIVIGQVPRPGEAVRKERTVDLTVVANPAPRHTLTVTVTGNGVVSGNGIACPGGCTSALAAGIEVTMTAIAGSANTFGGWGGSCAGTTSTTCRFTMPGGDVSVSAQFLFSPIPTASPEPPDPNPVVPNVVGLTGTAARDLLQRVGFVVEQGTAIDNICNNIGRVMRQQPAGGTRAARGSRIAITIGVRPPPPRECP